MQDFSDFRSVVKFHGHTCPGLIIGYRMAKRAMEELGVKRSGDEELVAIVMSDTCAVDAVQQVTGCTFGKGNLIFKDYGKHTFIFMNRKTGEAVRISESPSFEVRKVDPAFYDLRGRVLFGEHTPEDVAEVQRRAPLVYDAMLRLPDDEIMVVRKVECELPHKARLFKSLVCQKCGEKMAEPKARVADGKIVCMECFEEKYGHT